MKYLFWLLIILLAIWAFKRSRAGNATPSQNPPTAGPTEMVTCAHCGIHLPVEEAVSGQKGAYCSTEHRTSAHDRNAG
ncbi:hypothetical protein B9Z51_03985 [Limnohabitans sp. T6-5]|uniref:PP0621 family protein n=1 Tax=Limnohabitans sp. T6-5 TaxID=1100724 RepID=UPI000D3C9C3E|nr:PP0621 family protein [Limnohabitans sp. T6-5]PUE11462.1 hypothetical protein B9Z51_03985 [Limnohabitans sp. T6-5]